MKATALRISALLLAAALGSLGCGGDDESPSAAQAPVAAKKSLVKPKRMEPLPALPRRVEPPAPAPIPEAEEPLPIIPPDAPVPEGEQQLSNLPDDVPLPAGARAVSPLLESSEGIAHGTYEMPGSAASAATAYTAGLLKNGWSIEPARNTGPQALINATKDDRQLSIAIEESGNRSQIVILEMPRPPG